MRDFGEKSVVWKPELLVKALGNLLKVDFVDRRPGTSSDVIHDDTNRVIRVKIPSRCLGFSVNLGEL